MLFQPGPARRSLAFPHQHVETRRRFGQAVVAESHRQQAPRVRIHGGFPQLLGGFLGWGLLAATFTKSSVLNRSPMMTIAMAMIAVAIYMLVNMSRANKNQHQFS